MEATITFETNDQAKAFATAYSRRTFRGHTISAAVKPVQTVDVYGLNQDDIDWINAYLAAL